MPGETKHGPLRFVVPGNPIPWERARTRRGRYYTPKRTKGYQAAVQVSALMAQARPKAEVPIRLTVAFYRQDRQPCDLDNLAKTVQDALNGIAYRDDRQIVVLSASKVVDAARPRAEVVVEYLADEAVGGGLDQALEDHEDATAEKARTA